MEILPNGFSLEIPTGCFPLSTDSMVLADFVRTSARILDLGSGCGTLGVLLCAADPKCHVTGIELDPLAHNAALNNIHHNGLQARMDSICGDLRTVNQVGAFRCCVSNPPYFSGGAPSKNTPLARRDDCCSPQELFRTASRSLCWGGDFYLVHRPEMLAQLCACGCANNLEPKRLRLIRHREGGAVTLILLHCRKGGKPGLCWEEEALHDIHGNPTDYYKRVYHLT